MVSAKIINLTEGENAIFDGYYTLPFEHAQYLTRAHGEQNMAIYCQEIPLLTGHYKEIIKCFKEGGGVGYDKQP